MPDATPSMAARKRGKGGAKRPPAKRGKAAKRPDPQAGVRASDFQWALLEREWFRRDGIELRPFFEELGVPERIGYRQAARRGWILRKRRILDKAAGHAEDALAVAKARQIQTTLGRHASVADDLLLVVGARVATIAEPIKEGEPFAPVDPLEIHRLARAQGRILETHMEVHDIDREREKGLEEEELIYVATIGTDDTYTMNPVAPRTLEEEMAELAAEGLELDLEDEDDG